MEHIAADQDAKDWRKYDLGSRPNMAVKFNPATEKRQIEQLDFLDIEHGEHRILMQHNVKCEHNYPKLPELYGNLLMTNYKLVFLPTSEPGL